MEDSILKFAEQFGYEPEIINSEKLLKNYKHFVLGGMGGSALAADILCDYKPGIELYVNKDYGIPKYSNEFCKESLFIASSYSGNTEETFDFLDEAYSKGYDCLVVAAGGKLIEFAIENGLPYIQLPHADIQPRLAVGYSIMAISKVVLPQALVELKELQKTLNVSELKQEGQSIAETLNGKIPVIYTSTKNKSIAYNWKIKFNETGKIPAFYNVLPELNHNEMQGFDFSDSNKSVSGNFHFIIIQDSDDGSLVTKRMDVLEGLYQEKGFPVTKIYMDGNSRFEKIFKSILIADWTALSLANIYGVLPDKVPMIEEFKKRIS